MKHQTLMAIDPGSTTGYAWVQIKKSDKMESAHEFFKERWMMDKAGYGEYGDSRAAEAITIDKVLTQIKNRKPNVVIIESYTVRLPVRDTSYTALSPARIGGAIDYACSGFAWEPTVEWQTPSQMGVITDTRLKHWGLWLPGKKDARAALKHLLIYMRKLYID